MANPQKGWIKLYRSLQDKAFFKKDSEMVHLWLLLLMKANYSENREEYLGGKLYKCIPGEFTTGRRQLALETGINASKVERCLTYFEKIEQQIEQRKTRQNRLIIVKNWHLYQESEPQSEPQVNHNRTTSEPQVNTLKERKNSKKVRKKEEIKKDILSGKPDDIPYKKIIDYLNLMINSNYDHKTEKTRSLIRSLWVKYKLDDFKYVIEIKSQEWRGTEREKYLRPKTLFKNDNFESYRNQKQIKNQPKWRAGIEDWLRMHGEIE